MSDATQTEQTKAALRTAALARRDTLPPAERAAAAAAIAGRAFPVPITAGMIVAGFSPLKAGQWGIFEPTPEAPEVAPDILIVPLACFDRAGHRIGYGAGYYDLTINALRAKKKVIAIGIGFAAQEIPKVPATERDARLDLVLTEREVC